MKKSTRNKFAVFLGLCIIVGIVYFSQSFSILGTGNGITEFDDGTIRYVLGTGSISSNGGTNGCTLGYPTKPTTIQVSKNIVISSIQYYDDYNPDYGFGGAYAPKANLNDPLYLGRQISAIDFMFDSASGTLVEKKYNDDLSLLKAKTASAGTFDSWKSSWSQYVYIQPTLAQLQSRLLQVPAKQDAVYLYNNQIKLSFGESEAVNAYTWGNSPYGVADRCAVLNIQVKPDITFKALNDIYVFEKSNPTIDFVIENNFDEVPAIIRLDYSFDTPFGTSTGSKQYSQTLFKGQNNLSMEIPADTSGTLEVTPSIYIRLADSMNVRTESNRDYRQASATICKGVGRSQNTGDANVFCYGDVPTFAPIIGEKRIVAINPKPIYLNMTCSSDAECGSGYACQAESKLCIRSDVLEKKLTCEQIPCPIIENTAPYECSSSGVCVQTIYVQARCKILNETTGQDDCPTSTKCEPTSGLCIRDVFYNTLIQCSSSNDCVTPCVGKSVSCEENRCVYNGECTAIKYGCQQSGCDSGYSCDMDSGVCKQNPIIVMSDNLKYTLIAMIAIAGIVWYYKFRGKRRKW